MPKARQAASRPATTQSVASILEAEAQAREAVQVCRQQHEQTLAQAREQAARIHARAQNRVARIQAHMAARLQAIKGQGQATRLVETEAASGPDDRIAQAATRLAARLTGGRP